MSQHEPNIENELLETLKTTWDFYPDLRFTQLIVNAINPKDPCPEIFHVEDSRLIEKLQQLQPKPEKQQDSSIDSIDNIADMLELQQEVIDYFDSIEIANQWLHEPLPSLSGNKPIACFATPQGREDVRIILKHMSCGSFA